MFQTPLAATRAVCSSRTLILRSFCGLMFMISIQLNAQDSTRVVAIDSLKEDLVKVTPYYSYHQQESGFYSKKIEEPRILSLSNGISIFNVLRGNVPGLTISPSFASAGLAGARTGSSTWVHDALVVIDGISYNNYFSNYTTLNAFDFSSITSISNTNALSFLGGSNSGAFVLNSKNASGQTSPLLEISSFATEAWFEVPTLLGYNGSKTTEWHVNNALAYAQDFGAVDTRLSYTLKKNPHTYEGAPYSHNLKLNTGLDVDRLHIRLILDGRITAEEENIPHDPSAFATTIDRNQTFLSGNLSARYAITTWLNLSAQAAVNNFESEIETKRIDFRNIKTADYLRSTGNLNVNIEKQLGTNINISGFAGYSISKQKIYDYRGATHPDFGWLTFEEDWSLDESSFITQASLSYRDLLHFSGHWRSGTYTSTAYIVGEGKSWARSFSSAFMFSELMKSSILSLGRLRASTGSHRVTSFATYPIRDNYEMTEYHAPSHKTRPYDIENLEVGLDLGFLDSRLQTAINYFENNETYQVPEYAINAINSFRNKGWEAEINGVIVRRKNLSFETALLWSGTKSKYHYEDKPGDWSNRYVITRWRNDFNYKSFVATFLIESFDDYTGYQILFEDVSFTKLREITMGIRLPAVLLSRTFVKNANLSLTGRNLWLIDGSDPDIEENGSYPFFSKSVSACLNLTF